jgi:hypothetical protein
VYNGERGVWENVRPAHGVTDGPITDPDSLQRLVGRFLLAEGEDDVAHNSVRV